MDFKVLVGIRTLGVNLRNSRFENEFSFLACLTPPKKNSIALVESVELPAQIIIPADKTFSRVF